MALRGKHVRQKRVAHSIKNQNKSKNKSALPVGLISRRLRRAIQHHKSCSGRKADKNSTSDPRDVALAVSSTLAADPKRSPAQTLPSCVKASCEMVFSRSIRGVGYDALSAARCDLFRFSFFCVGRSASRLCNAKIKRGAHYPTTGRRYCFFLGTIVLTVSPCKAVDIKESGVNTINHRTRNGISTINTWCPSTATARQHQEALPESFCHDQTHLSAA